MKAALAIIFIFIIIGFAILIIPQVWELFNLPGFLGSGGDGGVFKSIDRAENFILSSGEKRQSISGLDILDIAVSSYDANLVYAGTRSNGLYIPREMAASPI